MTSSKSLSLIEKALKLRKEEKFEDAIDILENLHDKEPESVEIKKALIDTLFEYGGYLNDDYVLEYQKAADHFKKIVNIDAKNYRALYNLGIAYFNLDNMDEALRACNEALEIKPDYAHCHYNIGLIHESMEKHEKALASYTKASEIDHNFTYAIQAKKSLVEFLENQRRLAPDLKQKEKKTSKLKSLLKMSKRINVKMIQDLLEIDKTKLIEILIGWGDNYQFEIDGDFLTINKKTLPELLKNLKDSDFQ